MIVKFEVYDDNLEVIIDRKDDLPAPEGPIIVRKSPDCTWPERLCKTELLDFLSMRERFFH